MTWAFFILVVVIVGLVLLVARRFHPHRPHRRPAARRATVTRDIRPGGFGQVRVEGPHGTVLLAARSAGEEHLPAGTAVEIVDDSRSVVVVRRRAEPGDLPP